MPGSQQPVLPRTSILLSHLTVAAIGLLQGCSTQDRSHPTDLAFERVQLVLGLLGPDDAARVAGIGFDESERLIAECMAERGFEYVPASAADFVKPGSDPRVPTIEQAEENGLGVTIGVESLFDDPPADPNDAIVKGLNPDARRKFDQALDPRDPASCSAQGREHEAEFALWTDDWRTKLEQVRDELGADPVVSAVWDAWSDCMGNAGFVADTYEDLVLDFAGRAEPFFSDGDMTSEGFRQLQARELNAASAAATCMSDASRRDLDEASSRIVQRFVEMHLP
jgi:hypothetical protein